MPASKSYSIRAFIVAACGGESVIRAASDCDDAVVARNAARQLGCLVKRDLKNTCSIKAAQKKVQLRSLDVGESGTVLRFVLPLVSLFTKKLRIEGRGTLAGRPNHHLLQTLRQRGLSIKGDGPDEGIPIDFVGGELTSGLYTIAGDISSQFISALLITLPQLDGNSVIRISGAKVVSTDYLTMTLRILEDAGVVIDRRSEREFRIKGGQSFKGLKDFHVPSDYGLAAYHLAAATLLDSDVELLGHFADRYPQADGQILSLVTQMGVRYRKTNHSLRIKGPQALNGGEFSLRACPDLVPIMAILGLFAKGPTRLYGIGHARVKESDRISDLRRELLKIGADIKEKGDELLIRPWDVGSRKSLQVTLDPHHDHRLAMAFSVLGMKLGVTVRDIGCVAKSYPKFVQDIKKLGASCKKSP